MGNKVTIFHAQGLPMETYMMAFTYGSVVIFNASDAMTKRLLRMCRKVSKQVVQETYVEGAHCLEEDLTYWKFKSQILKVVA